MFLSAASSDLSLLPDARPSLTHSGERVVISSKRISGERELQAPTLRKKMRSPSLGHRRISSRLPMPDHIPKSPYMGSSLLPEIAKKHQIHDAESITLMRAAAELAARVLDYAGTLVRTIMLPNLHLDMGFQFQPHA
ncbi:hypothetical protein TorRG33x02_065450 [Trema orientale]|uniref:Uncharacterized protein n=1 Tax=Trema orientale TaxID=63057 RepID=A0A2P5FIK0_TREOI|nr:hypothetical protein TorRG33x02_065450 [Trema orientale]